MAVENGLMKTDLSCDTVDLIFLLRLWRNLPRFVVYSSDLSEDPFKKLIIWYNKHNKKNTDIQFNVKYKRITQISFVNIIIIAFFTMFWYEMQGIKIVNFLIG